MLRKKENLETPLEYWPLNTKVMCRWMYLWTIHVQNNGQPFLDRTDLHWGEINRRPLCAIWRRKHKGEHNWQCGKAEHQFQPRLRKRNIIKFVIVIKWIAIFFRLKPSGQRKDTKIPSKLYLLNDLEKISYWQSLVKMASFDFQLEAFWVPLQRESRQEWALPDHHHGWQEDLVHRVRSLGWGLLRILLFLSIWTWWKTIYSLCFRCRKSMLEWRWGLLRGLCCLLTLKRRGLNHYITMISITMFGLSFSASMSVTKRLNKVEP